MICFFSKWVEFKLMIDGREALPGVDPSSPNSMIKMHIIVDDMRLETSRFVVSLVQRLDTPIQRALSYNRARTSPEKWRC
jgi:hypothetical protein